MAEPCVATSSRSEGTPDGQLPMQADNLQQPIATGVAQPEVAPADVAAMPPTGRRRQQRAGEAQPTLDSGTMPEDPRPLMRTRRQAAKRGMQADFVRGDESDSDAARSAGGGRAGSSNSWHPGDADSDSDASTRKRRKTEQASLRYLCCLVAVSIKSVQPGPALAQLLVPLHKLTQYNAPCIACLRVAVLPSMLAASNPMRAVSHNAMSIMCRRPRTRCCSRRTAGAWTRRSCSATAAWSRALSAEAPPTATRASPRW